MSVKDLYETIHTWLMLYKDVSRPDVDENEVRIKYSRGLLKVVATLYMTEEIKQTPIEKHLNKAIEDAKSGDHTKLDEINVFLSEVERYLIQSSLN